MNDVSIQVENISKQYRLGLVGTGTLSHDLNRFWHNIRGKEDPYLKIGESNDRASKGVSDYVWALQDINFEVRESEVLGIIGKNGAGKSTLLKILSKVTTPTKGRIKVNGRIASLLEVGTGFHPDLTGRENVFLNGAILGMTKAEIKKKFDEIVDFSGVERYIDTPVKRYSSGMYVRLAFAIAAHLEPEILIVDEVLAVGDLDFQKKCLGKMRSVSEDDGRTVLFVSHNLISVKKLCNKGLLLERGMVTEYGGINEVIGAYTSISSTNTEVNETFERMTSTDSVFYLKSGSMHDSGNVVTSMFDAEEDIFISLEVVKKTYIVGLYGYLRIKNANDDIVIESDTFDYMPNTLDTVDTGLIEYTLKISKRVLAVGEYSVYLNFANAKGEVVDSPGTILGFSVTDLTTSRGSKRSANTSHIIKWIKK